MTETRFTWRWLLVIALVGIGMGLVIGLIAGWIIYPNIGSSSIASLSASAQNDYIILVANTYAYDQDASGAKRRLAQLQDKDIKTRVERLAKALAARKDGSAANVADLAVELGSEDSSLQVLAESIGSDSPPAAVDSEPTKIARTDNLIPAAEQATPVSQEPTAKPTKAKKKAVPTNAPAAAESTEVPATKVAATKVAATRAPTAEPTQPPPQAAPVITEFTPAFPAMWWDDVRFTPAQVAPGQQYWHLKYARYCDWSPDDAHATCDGFPGGGMGTSIYVMTVDESGNCITTDVNDDINDGSKYPLTTDALKKIEYSWNPYGYACDQNYEKGMYGEGNGISVPGMPSDRIEGLCLCNKTPVEGQSILQGHAHVRYFLIYQRTTR